MQQKLVEVLTSSVNLMKRKELIEKGNSVGKEKKEKEIIGEDT